MSLRRAMAAALWLSYSTNANLAAEMRGREGEREGERVGGREEGREKVVILNHVHAGSGPESVADPGGGG